MNGKTRRIGEIMAAVLLCMASVGCSASVSLGGGENSTTDDMDRCEYVDAPLAWDAAAPNGQVPEQVLSAYAVSNGAAEGTPASNEAAGLPLEPSGAAQAFTVSLSRGTPQPVYMGGDCGEALQLPVQLAVASDDGTTLSGSWDLLLRVDANGNAQVEQAFDASELQGSFQFPAPSSSQRQHHPTLSLKLSADGDAELTIGYYITETTPEAASQGPLLRSWTVVWPVSVPL